MTLHIKNYCHDRDVTDSFAKIITFTKLIDVVKTVQICFDPNDECTNIEEDVEIVREFREFEK
jgi:RNA polymerase Rpb1, domain 7